MLIDSHAHLSGEEYEEDRLEVVARARAAGVEALLNIATTPLEYKKGLLLREQVPSVYLVGATTPHDAASEEPEAFAFFAGEAAAGRLVALGETGLDYYHWRHTAEVQKALFLRYIACAHQYDLPLVIHCRDAFADFFEIIDHAPPVRGVLHCFTGSREEAEGVIARGFYLSLSGIITFPKSVALRALVPTLPLDRLLVETDAPYLAPRTRRGQRNEPAYVREVAESVAELYSLPFDTIAHQTTENARTLFRLAH